MVKSLYIDHWENLHIVSLKDIGVFLRLAIDILFLSAVMIFKAILFREASKDRVSGTHP